MTGPLTWFPIVLCLALLVSVRADVLTLSSGNKVTGKWLHSEGGQIKFLVNDQVRTYAESDVTEIVFGDANGRTENEQPLIKLGQTIEEVEAVLGRNAQVFEVGPKKIYIYKDFQAKIVFRNGKVDEIPAQPRLPKAAEPERKRVDAEPAPATEQQRVSPLIRVKANPADGLVYVWVPAGDFVMGCSPGDTECASNPTQYGDVEGPVHRVTITKGFWIGQAPVTQEAYERVTGRNSSRFRGPKLPVEGVGWNLARGYCETTGMRLPTEAEWEYAARAGTITSRYGELDEIAWYKDNSGGMTHEVMQQKPNPWGLYDMLGNIWEWTSDWSEIRYPGGDETDPQGPPGGETKILRGGGLSRPRGIRVSLRLRGNISDSISGLFGFRCVGS